MADERRLVDSAVVALATSMSTFAIADPALRWFAAAGRRSVDLGARGIVIALGLALVVGLLGARAHRSRSRLRALGWVVLATVAAVLGIVALWVWAPKEGDTLDGLFVGALELALFPPAIALAILPPALWSSPGPATRTSIAFAAAGSLVAALAVDVGICCQPASISAHNPSLQTMPNVVWLAAVVAVLGGVALTVAARASIAGPRQVTCFTLAGVLFLIAPTLLVGTLRSSWRTIATGTKSTLRSAARAPDGSVWIVGDGATVLHLASGSNAVVSVDAGIPARTSLYGVCAARSGLWIVGDAGVVLRGDPAGARWIVERPASPANAELRAVWCDDDGASLAVGGAGTILRRTREGAWEPRPASVTAVLSSVVGKGRDRFVLPFDGPLLRSDDEGETFHAIGPSAHGGYALAIGDDGALWVGSGLLLRSTDRGATLPFESVRYSWLPILSGYAGGREEYEGIAVRGATVFVAGPRIMRTDDGGATLSEEKVYSLSRMHALAIDGAGRVLAVGDDGVVLVRPPP